MLSRKSICLAITLAASILLPVGPAAAKTDVTLDRIVLQHLMHVVSTERADAISKYLFDLRLRDQSAMTPADLITKTKTLKDEEGILFIMDRSKAKHLSPEEESLLPCPTAAIEANQVILYSRKAKGRNAWEILISAPNEKWLFWELDRLCTSSLRNAKLDERGSTLDRYLVKRLLVVSTEGREVADSWIRGQTHPGGNAIDWDFTPAESWRESDNSGVDTVFLLDRQKLAANSAAVVKSLPRDAQTWFGGDSGKSSIVAAKETIQGDSPYSVQCIVAPCTRLLTSALAKYSSLDSIPGSLAQERMRDLSGYGQIAIVVRSGSQENAINDFGAKLNSALSASDTGFACVSRQDLAELVLNSIGDSDRIDATQLTQIRKKIGKARALVIADLTAVDANTSYSANSPTCETAAYAAFTAAEPTKPTEPDPDESILFKGKKYRVVDGSRRHDPHFIDDLRDYREKLLPKYETAHRRWKRDKADYEDSRRSHEMQWSRTVDAVQSVSVAANLKIYDAGSPGADTAGRLLFSCSLNGSAQRRDQFISDRVTVRGEDSKLGALQGPASHAGVSDSALVSQALEQACGSAAEEIKRTAILPSDVRNHAPSVVTEPEAKRERVSVDAVGSVKLSSRPIGATVEAARQAALENAYPKLVSNIGLACPGAVVSVDDIKDSVKIGSEGWNAQTHEYRIKARFEGLLSLQ